MTDLPRFHTGAQGRLDFTTLNEAFRRLDALRPLIEAAAVSGKLSVDLKPLVFPVFASSLAPQHPGKYGWREVLLRPDDTVVLSTDDDYEEILLTSQIRRGGDIDSKTNEIDENYGIVLDPQVDFSVGYCLCAVIRRIDASNIHVLFPQAVGDGGSGNRTAYLFRVGQFIEEVSLTIGNTTLSGHAYSGTLLSIRGNDTDEDNEVVLHDWSSNNINVPLTNTSSVQTSYHLLDTGTVLTVTDPQSFTTGPVVHFGAPCRLDFECI